MTVNKSVQTLMGHLDVLVEMGSGLAVMGGAVKVSCLKCAITTRVHFGT